MAAGAADAGRALTAMTWGTGPQRARLADGRWHFQHGPIDLVIAADGEADAVAAALEAAWLRFVPLLGALAAELPVLRRDARGLVRPTAADGAGPVPRATVPMPVAGVVAARMVQATAALGLRFDRFVTPMAAVAGAVAEHVAECFDRAGIRRASVNNGGDIALVLAPGAHWDIGVVADPSRPDVGATLRIASADRPRGVATSGWHGRSLSLGIADSVTVLADDAPAADAAATLIANEVDLPGHPRIVRRPADEIRDGSDLGRLPVTVGVPDLAPEEIGSALARGAAFARSVIDAGLARHALLTLQGRTVAVGDDAAASAARRVPGVALHVTMPDDAVPGAGPDRPARPPNRPQEPPTCPHRSAS